MGKGSRPDRSSDSTTPHSSPKRSDSGHRLLKPASAAFTKGCPVVIFDPSALTNSSGSVVPVFGSADWGRKELAARKELIWPGDGSPSIRADARQSSV